MPTTQSSAKIAPKVRRAATDSSDTASQGEEWVISTSWSSGTSWTEDQGDELEDHRKKNDTEQREVKEEPHKKSEAHQPASNECALPEGTQPVPMPIYITQSPSCPQPLEGPSGATPKSFSQLRQRYSISHVNKQGEDEGSSCSSICTFPPNFVSENAFPSAVLDIVSEPVLLEQSKTDSNDTSDLSPTSPSAAPGHGNVNHSAVSNPAVHDRLFNLLPGYLRNICANGMISIGLLEPPV